MLDDIGFLHHLEFIAENGEDGALAVIAGGDEFEQAFVGGLEVVDLDEVGLDEMGAEQRCSGLRLMMMAAGIRWFS